MACTDRQFSGICLHPALSVYAFVFKNHITQLFNCQQSIYRSKVFGTVGGYSARGIGA